jgi:hypothetical protein
MLISATAKLESIRKGAYSALVQTPEAALASCKQYRNARVKQSNMFDRGGGFDQKGILPRRIQLVGRQVAVLYIMSGTHRAVDLTIREANFLQVTTSSGWQILVLADTRSIPCAQERYIGWVNLDDPSQAYAKRYTVDKAMVENEFGRPG